MMIESLEHRQLLSASAVELPFGILVVRADNNGDDLTITENAHIVDPTTGNPLTRVVQVFQNTVDVDGNEDSTLVGGIFTNVNKIIVLGGNGADSVDVTTQDVGSYIDGGNGNDLISVTVDPDDFDASINDYVLHPEYTGGCNTILGGNGDDTIIATGLSNSQISGGNGADNITVRAAASNSLANRGKLIGGKNILINGDNDNDIIAADHVSCSIVSGDNGNDQIFISNSQYTLVVGGNGTDTIEDDFGGTNVIDGGNGRDVIVATVGDCVIQIRGDSVTFS